MNFQLQLTPGSREGQKVTRHRLTDILGQCYRPPMSSPTTNRPPNRLIHETSPYLLQHAHNPIDWYPWGKDALSRAQTEDKPILLSIGYSACHWCHVMERESFENEEIAKLMNQDYVCIKVDREERPDLDEIYMQATLAMNQGNGGWPMTVFLTPDQQPIFAGTYFPPTDKWGRPGFSTVLKKIAEGWHKDRAEIVDTASRFTAKLQKSIQVPSPTTIGQDELDAGTEQFAKHFDPVFGGFGQAPKFPPATGLSFLLRQYHHTGNEHTLTMVRKTLDAMAAGGMYDHIAGGFSRYSTDERWLVPHFEKMLYDNALLAKTYVEAFQVTQADNYRRVATEILDYIIREMTSPEGGFYSATDADSEGVEGKFFVWDPEQIKAIVPSEEDAKRFCAYYDITDEGNWEHHSIPNTPRALDAVAQEIDCSPEELQQTIDRVRPLVYQARLTRVPPGLDDKIITAWNGMMISTMAEASRVFGHPQYLQAATNAADFLLRTLSRPDGGLFRTYRENKAHLDAYLEDYAFLIEALIDIYEAGGSEHYLSEAVRLAERLLQDFSDQEYGGFFTTAKDHETLILRSREGPDGATPSGNAVAATALARLSFHFGREDLRDAATQAIRAYGQQIAQIPRGFAKTLIASDLLLKGPIELALVGSPEGHQALEALSKELRRHFVPNRIIAHYDPQNSKTSHPLLKDKTLVNGQPALYICKNFACAAPLTDPKLIKQALAHQLHPDPDQPTTQTTTLKTSGITGKATAQGTAAYVSRMLSHSKSNRPSASGYGPLGSTGLTTSRIGFGGYRITEGHDEHREALRKALREGCNIIDTSTNYTDGSSERLIGQVIKELLQAQEMTREEVIVVSKIGYVQGQNLARAETKEQTGHPYPDMVKYGEGLWHCLHPEFLEDQFALSLDRLGLETLDVCLLHNPEYFLSDVKNQKLIVDNEKLQELRNEFYRRLQQAFEYFETQVTAGRLQYYGVSSNTSTTSPDDPEATSLSRIYECAKAAGNTLGKSFPAFRVLQLPMNLFESGALLTPNTGSDTSKTVLEFAQQEQIAILVNRPLNAIPSKHRGMIRLANPHTEPVESTFEELYEQLGTLEEEFREKFVPHIPYSGKGLEPKDFFSFTEELKNLRPRLQGLEHWDQIESQMIAPHVNQALQVVSKHLGEDHANAWSNWQHRYIPKLLTFFLVLRKESAQKNREAISAISGLIDPHLPKDKRSESISSKSLWILTSTSGVTCVLNGMRTSAYVEEALKVLHWAPLSNPRDVFEKIRNPQ
ncbi:aldo/keto reductase [Candidatus Nitronereus thalassa]|uniref:Aldo/keto reductase n=1 Tax=Candidatus Nitronereus thalassa TaxID=3020898 RepID=A0ABU3KCJ9_9BACT|nr:aldo/keto reductase [Candidatus Nitronereus thalassa]MDT7044245.1 aldo/keto reductase [Candidatus Nitronereus thalassa]